MKQEVMTKEEADRFYYSTPWKKFRANYIAQHPEERECVLCLHPVEGRNLVLDHIVGIRQGGAKLDEANIQVLCLSCNARKRSNIFMRANYLDEELVSL